MSDTEADIAARLQRNVVVEDEMTVASATPPGELGVATGQFDNFAFDDTLQYKVHEFFGEQYRKDDEESKKWAEYIYRTVAQMVGTTDYSYVMAQARQVEQMLGLSNSDRRMYRLYQWLKLDSVRRKVTAEMDAVVA